MKQNIEIERRFLLANDNWRHHASSPQRLQQGYISVAKECTIRIRIIDQQAWLTIKGYISDMSRSEFEYSIDLEEAQIMMATLCPFKLEKLRYHVYHQGHLFEIDEYFDENAPLVVAEIELSNEYSQFAIPEWLGEEITFDGRFTNAYLSRHPYGTWTNEKP